MKVLCCYPVPFPFRNMAVRNRILFLSKKYELTFMTTQDVEPPEEFAADGTRFLVSPFKFGNSHLNRISFFMWAVAKMLFGSGMKFDMAYSFQEDTSLMAGYMAKALGRAKNWAVDFLDDPELELNNWSKRNPGLYKTFMVTVLSTLMSIYKRVIHKAFLNIVQGDVPEDQLPRHMHEKYKIPFDKMVLVSNGVSLETVDPSKVEIDESKRADGVFRIFYVGYISRLRGMDLLLDSVAAAKDELGQMEVLLGGFMDDEAEEWLYSTAEKLGVRESIKFLGVLSSDQVWKNMVEADVCVYPFQLESISYVYPAKVFEYMALARPVVASRHEGVSKMITHGESGFLVSPHDPAEWADAFARIRNEDGLAESLGKNARAAMKKFDWKVIHGKIEKAINEKIVL